jgi:acyl carrier protein
VNSNRLQQIEEQLRSLVASRLKINPSSVPLHVPIIAELGLDSMEVMQFLLDVEERFPKFRFTDHSASDLRTLRELARRLAEIS